MSGVLCCGTRREGKTTLAIHLARQWSPTVVAWDPRGSVRGLVGPTESLEVRTPDELRAHLESGDYLANEEHGNLILVYRSETEDGFAELCEVLFPPYFEGYQGGLALIVDEAGTLQTAHAIHPALNRVIGQCPDTILVVQTTHMISEWHGKSRSCMNEMFLFRQVGARNWQVVAENCGDDVAEQCVNLPPHHLVHYWFDRREGLQWELWDQPPVWALNSLDTTLAPGVESEPDEVSATGEGEAESEEPWRTSMT